MEKATGAVPLSLAHKDICDFIDLEKNKYKLLLVPRNHLKSTLVTVGHSVQSICENPKVRILIANATYGLSVSFLDQIKAHLKGNPKIHHYYGDLSKYSSKWSENQIKVSRSKYEIDYEKKEPTVTVMGVGGSLTSQHYDKIFLDDVVNRENITSLEQMQKVVKFYKDCLDLLEPGGELIIIGTRWHDRDLYGWIMEGDHETEGQIPKKILQEIMPYQFVFKGPDFNIMKRKIVEGDQPIWPEKFNNEHIELLKKQKGPYEFSSQYNNEPLPEQNQQFKKSWFRYYWDDDLKDRNIYRFTMCDPAISQSDDADYTVFITIAMDQYYNWFVEHLIRKRMLPNEIIDTMFKVFNQLRPTQMGLETVAFQKMLGYAIRDEMRLRKQYLPLIELKPHNNRDKESRIKSLQPGYYSGKIFHKKNLPGLEYLEDELLRFPKGSHDDIIDALSYMTEFAFPAKKESLKRSKTYLY